MNQTQQQLLIRLELQAALSLTAALRQQLLEGTANPVAFISLFEQLNEAILEAAKMLVVLERELDLTSSRTRG